MKTKIFPTWFNLLEIFPSSFPFHWPVVEIVIKNVLCRSISLGFYTLVITGLFTHMHTIRTQTTPLNSNRHNILAKISHADKIYLEINFAIIAYCWQHLLTVEKPNSPNASFHLYTFVQLWLCWWFGCTQQHLPLPERMAIMKLKFLLYAEGLMENWEIETNLFDSYLFHKTNKVLPDDEVLYGVEMDALHFCGMWEKWLLPVLVWYAVYFVGMARPWQGHGNGQQATYNEGHAEKEETAFLAWISSLVF